MPGAIIDAAITREGSTRLKLYIDENFEVLNELTQI